MRLGDVVDQDDAADHGEVARDQRRDGDVDDPRVRRCVMGKLELVQVVDARLVLQAPEFAS